MHTFTIAFISTLSLSVHAASIGDSISQIVPHEQHTRHFSPDFTSNPATESFESTGKISKRQVTVTGAGLLSLNDNTRNTVNNLPVAAAAQNQVISLLSPLAITAQNQFVPAATNAQVATTQNQGAAPVVAAQNQGVAAPVVAAQNQGVAAPVVAAQNQGVAAPVVAAQNQGVAAPVVAAQNQGVAAPVVAAQNQGVAAPVVAAQNQGVVAPVVAAQNQGVTAQNQGVAAQDRLVLLAGNMGARDSLQDAMKRQLPTLPVSIPIPLPSGTTNAAREDSSQVGDMDLSVDESEDFE